MPGSPIAMKTHAALTLMLGGLSLWSLPCNGWRRTVGKSAAALVGLIAAATLAEHAFHVDVGIDQRLFGERCSRFPVLVFSF